MSILLAALFGGLVCAVVQVLIDLTKLTPARILVTLVTTGVLLYALGLYDPLEKIFGRGITVPLLGFGANIARGVKEAVATEGYMGILTGPLSSSAAGISFALIAGFIASLFSKGKPKRL